MPYVERAVVVGVPVALVVLLILILAWTLFSRRRLVRGGYLRALSDEPDAPPAMAMAVETLSIAELFKKLPQAQQVARERNRMLGGLEGDIEACGSSSSASKFSFTV